MTREAKKGLKVALVQLDANDELWDVGNVEGILGKIGKDIDLIVFPEVMPFWNFKGKKIKEEDARSALQKIKHPVPIILGGYVDVGDGFVNRSFLLVDGEICGEYDKQIPFDEVGLKLGKKVEVFQFNDTGCIPLICADACQEFGPDFIALMHKINLANKDKNFPIVVSSYGSGLDDADGWQESLFALANFCQVPVVICGVSGKSKETYFDSESEELRHYGGGGSAVFWPHKKTEHKNIKLPKITLEEQTLTTWRAQEHSPQLNVPAIFVIDLDSRELKIRSLV